MVENSAQMTHVSDIQVVRDGMPHDNPHLFLYREYEAGRARLDLASVLFLFAWSHNKCLSNTNERKSHPDKEIAENRKNIERSDSEDQANSNSLEVASSRRHQNAVIDEPPRVS